MVTVEAGVARTTWARASLFELEGRCFVSVGRPLVARIGRAGLSTRHREGDGSTPEGAYGIGPVIYGIGPNPGLHYPYRRVTCGDWWDEDPASPRYNRFVALPCGAVPPFALHSEALWTEAPFYDAFAVIEYNVDPIVAGRGSGIFLHSGLTAPTEGCVALAPEALDATLRWLRPADHPLVVIGTAADLSEF